jgi:hypothetical protein
MKKNKSKKSLFGLSKKEIIVSIVVPIIITLLTVFITGHFQIKAILKSNEVHIESTRVANEAIIESATKSAEAQIEAAKITKVKEIEYDFKETSNWDVSQSKSYMPLGSNYYWIYEGEYTGYSYQYKDYFTKKVLVKFEIIEGIENNGLSLYIVKNLPTEVSHKIDTRFNELSRNELNSDEPIVLDGGEESGLLLIANKLFIIPEEHVKDTKEFVLDPLKVENQQLSSLHPLSPEDILFEFPMFKGQRFGSFESISRGDLSYFWFVNQKREIQTLNKDTFELVPVFELIYNTLPDTRMLVFRPYVGILSYKIIHNGSIKDLTLHLKEFNISD